jgi:hypothetical protein
MVESPLREKCVERGIMNSLRGSIELCGDFPQEGLARR